MCQHYEFFIFPSHLSTFHLKQIQTRKVSLASRFHQRLLVLHYTFPILAFPRRSPMHFNHALLWKHKYWNEMVTETIFSREEEINLQTLCAERGWIRWNLERAQKSTKCHFLFRWKMIMSSHNASCTAADIWWESAFFFSFPTSPSRTRFFAPSAWLHLLMTPSVKVRYRWISHTMRIQICAGVDLITAAKSFFWFLWIKWDSEFWIAFVCSQIV